MSWIRPDYINRDLPLTAKDRKAIYRSAWKLWWGNKSNIVVYLTLPACYLLAVPFASDAASGIATLLGASGPIHRLFRVAGPVMLPVLCFIVGGAVLQRYRFAPCVYRAVRLYGYDVCTGCGYWLTRLSDRVKRCPECGTEREPMPESKPKRPNDNQDTGKKGSGYFD